MTYATDKDVKYAILCVLDNRVGTSLTLFFESRFGSIAFDTHFNYVPTKHIVAALREYANDENDARLIDFLGTVNEYEAMPVRSLYTHMLDTALHRTKMG